MIPGYGDRRVCLWLGLWRYGGLFGSFLGFNEHYYYNGSKDFY